MCFAGQYLKINQSCSAQFCDFLINKTEKGQICARITTRTWNCAQLCERFSRQSRHILRSSRKKKIEVQNIPRSFIRIGWIFANTFFNSLVNHDTFCAPHPQKKIEVQFTENSSADQSRNALPFLIPAHFRPFLRRFFTPVFYFTQSLPIHKTKFEVYRIFCQKTFYKFRQNNFWPGFIFQTRLGLAFWVSFLLSSFWVPSELQKTFQKSFTFSRLSYLQSTIRGPSSRLLVPFWPPEDFS